MLDRQQQPDYTEIGNIHFHQPQIEKLSNGIPVIIFQLGTQKILKIDFIFDAGLIHQKSSFIASTTGQMLQEGSKHLSGKEIAEKVDFLGSHLQISIDKDYAKITLFTLSKYAKENILLLSDIIQNPSFPQEQLETYISKKRQVFQMEMQKVKTLASRKFSETLFGANHPYGIVPKLQDYDTIQVETLQNFFKEHYTSNHCKISIAGNFDIDLLSLLEQEFSKNWNTKSDLSNLSDFKLSESEEKDFLINKNDALQSSIRVGKLLFNRENKDYQAMQIVNTILGGYFGSRLMHNIREDKGYTYGIGSAIVPLKQTGYFIIASEVNAQFSHQTIAEIHKEIDILQQEKVSNNELEKVKSYMLGQLIRAVDGPFALSDTFLDIWLQGLDFSYYQQYIETIKTMDSQRIQELSNQYLQKDSLIKIIAGK